MNPDGDIMKRNRISVLSRLSQRISRLTLKEDDAWVKIGGGNPYLKCRYCGVTNVNVTYDGHRGRCEIKGIHKEINYYKKLLASEYDRTN